MNDMTTKGDIPVNSLVRHLAPLRARLVSVAEQVIDSGMLVLGPQVDLFEADFARYCGVPHCVGVANGTDAIELALKAVGVRPGDAVVLAPNAAMYGTVAVLAAGAHPVYADVRAEDGTLDPVAVAKALEATPQVRAILATHLYGRLADVDAIGALAANAGIPLVEDCAQSHGARLPDGRRAGAFGAAAAFSFYPTKNLGALGDGGAVVCRDEEVMRRLRSLRQYGWSDKYTAATSGGRNSRLDELQAAFLRAILPSLDGWNARRRAIAARYGEGIRHSDIVLPLQRGEDDVVHLYVVRSPRRDALRASLRAEGIGTDIHYPVPDHRQPALAGLHAGYPLHEAERAANEVLTLPCFPELTEDEIDRIIAACNRF